MALATRWERSNPLIRRVRQHGAFTTLFRAVQSEGAPLTPVTTWALGQLLPTPTPVVGETPASEETLPTTALSTLDPLSAAVEPMTSVPLVPLLPTPTAAMSAPITPSAGAVVQPALAQPVPVNRGPMPTRPGSTSNLVQRQAGVAQTVGVRPTQPLPVVAATLPAMPTAPLPTPTGVTPTLPPPPALPLPGIADPTMAAVPAVPRSEPALSPPPVVQRQPAAPPAPASDGIDDRTWARLQAAYDKLKGRTSERRPAAATASANPVAPASDPATPVNPGQSAAGPTLGEQPSAAQLQRTAQTSEPTATPPLPLPTAPVAPAPSVAPTAPALRTTGMAPALPAAHSTLAPTAAPSPPVLAVADQPSVAVSGAMMAESEAVLAAESAAAQTSANLPPLQTMLQNAAWPVQRLAETPLEATAPGALTSPTVVPDDAYRPPATLTEPVRSHLARVQTQAPTAAKVDLLLPRRPRPVARGATKPVQLAPAIPAEPTQGQPPLAARAEGAASLIETQIGPLPADLWQLIGEPVPQQTPAPADAAPLATLPEPAAAMPAAVDHSVVAPQPDTAAMQRLASPPVVQRLVAPMSAATSEEPAGLKNLPSPEPTPPLAADASIPVSHIAANPGVAGAAPSEQAAPVSTFADTPAVVQAQSNAPDLPPLAAGEQPADESGSENSSPAELSSVAKPTSRAPAIPLTTAGLTKPPGNEPLANPEPPPVSGAILAADPSISAASVFTAALAHPDEPAAPVAVMHDAPLQVAARSSAAPAAAPVIQARPDKRAPQRRGRGSTTQRRSAPPGAAQTVQRAATEEGADPAIALTAASPPADPASTPAAAPVDVDTLAQQVYRQLKHKLAVERERLR